MIDLRFQAWVSFGLVLRVGDIQHGLKLGKNRLPGKTVVIESQGLCLAEIISETRHGKDIHPFLRGVAAVPGDRITPQVHRLYADAQCIIIFLLHGAYIRPDALVAVIILIGIAQCGA